MSVSAVRIVLERRNVSIVVTHVICYFVLIVADATIVLAA